ncbi:MAG: hypothetical protein KatS3mg056_0484 [Chloroflexus sp.]|nr:MAG: hypothetical protein KatS3mg056_0484 [Chloroflexus sp.]
MTCTYTLRGGWFEIAIEFASVDIGIAGERTVDVTGYDASFQPAMPFTDELQVAQELHLDDRTSEFETFWPATALDEGDELADRPGRSFARLAQHLDVGRHTPRAVAAADRLPLLDVGVAADRRVQPPVRYG